MAVLPIKVEQCPHCGNKQYNPLAPLDIALDDGRIWGKRCTWWDCKRIIAIAGADRDGKALPYRSDELTSTDKAYLRFHRWRLMLDRRRWRERATYPLMLRPKDAGDA